MDIPSNTPSNSSKNKAVSIHVIVTGRVQGVGYRFFAQQEAQNRGLTGWVRNKADGSVEAIAEGTRSTLESWVEILHKGPPLARVQHINIDWSDKLYGLPNFSVDH